jgi:hypothetical protein
MGLTGSNVFASVAPGPNETDGPLVNVSTMGADKTITLPGSFDGEYVLLGSHDGVRFVPIAKFLGGDGLQTIVRTFSGTLQYVRSRRSSPDAITMSISGQAVCPCS